MPLLGTPWRKESRREAEPSAAGVTLCPLLCSDTNGDANHKTDADTGADVPDGDSDPRTQRNADSNP